MKNSYDGKLTPGITPLLEDDELATLELVLPTALLTAELVAADELELEATELLVATLELEELTLLTEFTELVDDELLVPDAFNEFNHCGTVKLIFPAPAATNTLRSEAVGCSALTGGGVFLKGRYLRVA